MRRSWTFPVTLIGALFSVSLALTGLNLTHHLPQRQWLTALWQPDRNDIDQMVFHFSLLPRLAIALLAGAGLGWSACCFSRSCATRWRSLRRWAWRAALSWV